jgi:putative peptidoglycan lipid II flippase
MLYHTLKKRGHFESDARLRRKVPRLAIAAALMGVAVYFVAPFVTPYLAGSILHRAEGLLALVTAGFAVYAIACFVTGAFVMDDIKLLTKRARQA